MDRGSGQRDAAGSRVGTLAGTPTANRVLRVLSLFTIQSNILSGVTSAQLARNPQSRRAGLARGATGFPVRQHGHWNRVFDRLGEGARAARLAEASTNNVFHYVVPIMMALGWLLFGPRPRIEVRTIALAMLWPVAWIVYILIYGAITKWYPYPFLDVTTHGYGRVIVNDVAVVAVLFVVTGLYWLGDRRLPATDRTADKAAHRTRQHTGQGRPTGERVIPQPRAQKQLGRVMCSPPAVYRAFLA